MAEKPRRVNNNLWVLGVGGSPLRAPGSELRGGPGLGKADVVRVGLVHSSWAGLGLTAVMPRLLATGCPMMMKPGSKALLHHLLRRRCRCFLRRQGLGRIAAGLDRVRDSAKCRCWEQSATIGGDTDSSAATQGHCRIADLRTMFGSLSSSRSTLAAAAANSPASATYHADRRDALRATVRYYRRRRVVKSRSHPAFLLKSAASECYCLRH